MEQSRKEFRDSKWFTRGWTLQELLAPQSVLFYDRNWTFIGQKSTKSMTVKKLAYEISNITNIAVEYLEKEFLVRKACAAVKMSWVSRRQTSRSEDMAYCMLGIFDVNMPLLYGEGRKAFFRLQSEIIKQSNDESIFAWIMDPSKGTVRVSRLFAPIPICFAESGTVERLDMQRPPWLMRHSGLAIHVPNSDIDGNSKAYLRLSCWKRKDGQAYNHPTKFNVQISLRALRPKSNIYYRVSCHRWLQDKAENSPSAEELKNTTCLYIRNPLV